MASLKTTIALLVILMVSLGICAWQGHLPQSAAVVAVPEASAAPPSSSAAQHSATLTAPRRSRRSLERAVFQLNTTKTAEEQRLYDLKLYHALQEDTYNHGISHHLAAQSRGGITAQELVTIREREFQLTRKRFYALEDYVLNTDFTELNEEEKDKIFQFYELRKRIEEARDHYFDIPVEEWVALSRENAELRDEFSFLIQRQLQHDSQQISLGNALRNYCPHIGEGSFSIGGISIRGFFPSVWL